MNTFIQKYGSFFLLAIGIIGIVWLNLSDRQTSDSAVMITTVSNYEQTMTTEKPSIYYVDIKGDVQFPGVYTAGISMRISDIVEMAGGLLPSADVSSINLSKNIYDQMVIYIPTSTQSDFSQNDIIYFVDVKGNVNAPGVYSVEKGTRIYQVIALAGGFTANADASMLNLSQEVVDEMVIFVDSTENNPTVSTFKAFIGGEVLHPGEYYVSENATLQALITLAGGLTEKANSVNLVYQMTLFDGFSMNIPSIIDSESPIVVNDNGLININTANIDSLMTLNGIGIILGQRIIDYRAEYGFFESTEDIMNVSGIKDSIYETIKNDITV